MTRSRFGPMLFATGVTFRLWAPAARSVEVIVGNARHTMTRSDGGWFATDVDGAGAGTRYRFRIDDEVDIPDPASAFQPDDVAGPSVVVDHDAFTWQTADWS